MKFNLQGLGKSILGFSQIFGGRGLGAFWKMKKGLLGDLYGLIDVFSDEDILCPSRFSLTFSNFSI